MSALDLLDIARGQSEALRQLFLGELALSPKLTHAVAKISQQPIDRSGLHRPGSRAFVVR